jgi:hypothetical protein
MQHKNTPFPARTRAVALAAALAAAFLSTEPAQAGQVHLQVQVQALATPGNGAGFSPNKFLDASIAAASGQRDVIGVSDDLEVRACAWAVAVAAAPAGCS